MTYSSCQTKRINCQKLPDWVDTGRKFIGRDENKDCIGLNENLLLPGEQYFNREFQDPIVDKVYFNIQENFTRY